MGIPELLNNTKSPAKAELYRRFSDSFMIVPMALLALVLGYVRPRGNSRTIGVMMGLLVFMIYLNFIKLGENRVSSGRWSLAQAMGLVHGSMMVLSLLAIWYRQNAWRFSFSQLLRRR